MNIDNFPELQDLSNDASDFIIKVNQTLFSC